MFVTNTTFLLRCRFQSLTDINSNLYTLFHCGTRWLSFRLEFMCVVVTLFVALFIVLSDNEVVGPGLKGLVLCYTIGVHLGSKSVKVWLIFVIFEFTNRVCSS